MSKAEIYKFMSLPDGRGSVKDCQTLTKRLLNPLETFLSYGALLDYAKKINIKFSS
jgi:hypothetical protein